MSKNMVFKVVGLPVFLILTYMVFAGVTYLVRPVHDNRMHMVGIKSEKEHIDVAYIGGSASYVYFEPMKAFSDYGFTSYVLGTDAIHAECILPEIKYIKEYQDPELFVIDARPFQYYLESQKDAGIRRVSDAMNVFDPARIELVKECVDNGKIEKGDILSHILDIAYYHTNYPNLSSSDAWELIDNIDACDTKGCELYDIWSYLEKPDGFQTDERGELIQNAEKVLREILTYCKDNDINLLFVDCPYSITKEHYAMYNSVADIVRSYGYNFLEANDHYDEMGMDFATDFYNINHVNAIGAEKYTSFLADYIDANYELNDNRKDERFSTWIDEAVDFQNYSEELRENVKKRITDAEAGVSQGDAIRGTEEFAKWCGYVKDYRYSLIAVGNGTSLYPGTTLDMNSLNNLGFDLNELYWSENYMNVLADDMHEISVPEETDGVVSVQVGQINSKTKAVITEKADQCSIVINDEECSRGDTEGLNIVVFDNYYRTIIDSVTLQNEDGSIVIVR